MPNPAPTQAMVVFDLDGVLVEVSDSYRAAIRETVAVLGGGAVSPEAVQELKDAGGFNNDWDLSLELLRRRRVEIERPRVIEVFDRIYMGPRGDGEGGLAQTERWLLPLALVDALRRRYRLAIFTGRPRRDADYALRRFGMAAAFDHVIALEDVSLQKPDPEGLYELRRLHAPAALAAYIGDSVDDARCAAAADVSFIAIVPEQQPRRAASEALFRACGCRFLGDGPGEGIVTGVEAAARQLLNGAGTGARLF